MRSTSRLLAGVVVLGLFCFVVVLASGRSTVTSATGTGEVKSQWDETRKGSTTKP